RSLRCAGIRRRGLRVARRPGPCAGGSNMGFTSVARLLASAVLTAIPIVLPTCSATGSAEMGGKIYPPFSDPIEWSITVEVGGSKTIEADAGERNAHKCVQITWLDKNREVVATTILSTDDQGVGTGPVPERAESWIATVIDCPE